MDENKQCRYGRKEKKERILETERNLKCITLNSKFLNLQIYAFFLFLKGKAHINKFLLNF